MCNRKVMKHKKDLLNAVQKGMVKQKFMSSTKKERDKSKDKRTSKQLWRSMPA